MSCGWCSLDGGGASGAGHCAEEGAADSDCDAASVTTSLLAKANLIPGGGGGGALTTAAPRWNFFTCPPENECLNGNHDCDEEAEDCVDTDDFYECVCKEGFSRSHG